MADLINTLIAFALILGALYIFIPQFREYAKRLIGSTGKKQDRATVQRDLASAIKDLEELEAMKKEVDQLNEKKRRIAELKKELRQ